MDQYEAHRWSIEAGAEKRALYGDAVRPLTDAEREIIESEATLDSEGLAQYAHIYGELSTTRGWNGYIPVTEIHKWCQFHDLPREAALRLVQVILRVDAAIVRKKNAKTKESGDT